MAKLLKVAQAKRQELLKSGVGPNIFVRVQDFDPVIDRLNDTAEKAGYSVGEGGAVTQAINRTTGVTLNAVCGTITTNNASLAAEGSADFIVTNSLVAIGDVVILSIQSGENSGGTVLSVQDVAAGSFTIRVHNGNVAAGTAETGAILINFAVIKAVSA